ncbi:MAG TPA: hypothetical protein VL123_02880 [Candidatus Udaeobacter sp.]|jgi:hypothetical protein|nr:hypothetical protein [Candidatus Udaeobacter sp.]
MRFRAWILLCLFALVLGVGCRKPLTPADNNQAPETWITSAPQDTLTVKDKDGHPIPTAPGTIPVAYHLYWAGSDVDGAIAGYYFAVVETTTMVSPEIPLPNLPGPKPQDYHFTTRTDSTFIFNVTEASPDRQHAFFIYAVDNKGKADPTPARFIFDAQDRYPPAVYMDQALASGSVWRQDAPGAPPQLVPYAKVITDTFDLHNPTLKDTVSSAALLNFRWHGEPTLAGTFVTGYRYKLDEPQFVIVDSSVHSVTYNSGINGEHVQPGAKQFTLRAVDYAGGAHQTTRRFQLNISPVTWFSGPDPNAYPYTHNGRYTYLDLATWAGLPSIDGSFLNKDSVQVLPALRPERKTFFEIYKNRLYVRSEGDTVDMNSWVVLSNGGFDPDSPYSVPVSSNDPSLPDTSGIPPGSAAVMHPGPSNGSPVGFKGVVTTFLTLNGSEFGPELTPSLSRLYPNFDPASVQRNTVINGYYGMVAAGKSYALVKAVDGFQEALVGAQDNVIPDQVGETARQLVEKVDAGGGTAQENDIRRRVLTFFVDKPPYLVTSDPNFKPAANGSTAYPSRTLDLYLVGLDDDPYDPDIGAKPNRIGGPSQNLVLRWTLSFRGKDNANHDVVWAPEFLKNLLSGGSGRLILSSIVLDPSLQQSAVTLDVQLCDCRECELALGEGRCSTFSIPFTVPPSPVAPQSSRLEHTGTGSPNVSGRSAP